MNNLKIKVNNPEESERAQRAFFALGGQWNSRPHPVRDFLHLNEPYLFFGDADFDTYMLLGLKKEISFCSTKVWFESRPNQEITLAELEEVAGLETVGA